MRSCRILFFLSLLFAFVTSQVLADTVCWDVLHADNVEQKLVGTWEPFLNSSVCSGEKVRGDELFLRLDSGGCSTDFEMYNFGRTSIMDTTSTKPAYIKLVGSGHVEVHSSSSSLCSTGDTGGIETLTAKAYTKGSNIDVYYEVDVDASTKNTIIANLNDSINPLITKPSGGGPTIKVYPGAKIIYYGGGTYLKLPRIKIVGAYVTGTNWLKRVEYKPGESILFHIFVSITGIKGEEAEELKLKEIAHPFGPDNWRDAQVEFVTPTTTPYRILIPGEIPLYQRPNVYKTIKYKVKLKRVSDGIFLGQDKVTSTIRIVE